MDINKIENWLRKQPTRKTKLGNIMHTINMDSERYIVDFAENFTSEGWLQYDTDQDAHYFGCWVNPTKLLTMCYCEGDWSLVVCADKAAFNAEIEGMNEFYDEGYEFKTIDADGTLTIYRQDREKFAIA